MLLWLLICRAIPVPLLRRGTVLSHVSFSFLNNVVFKLLTLLKGIRLDFLGGANGQVDGFIFAAFVFLYLTEVSKVFLL